MRLRTRLALAFALLALVPLAVVVPLTLTRLRDTLSRELDARMTAATASAQESLERSASNARRAVEELVESPAMEDLVREARDRPLRAIQAGTAEGLMKSRGLTVLTLFDRNGTVLSSGHLPARRGDPDAVLFAVTKEKSPRPVPVRVDVRGNAGLRQVPALVTARPVDYGDVRLWAVGGVVLDDGLAQHLARLTQTDVTLLSGEATVAHAGSAAPPTVARVLPLGDAASVRLTFSRAAAREAEEGVMRAFLLLAGLGLAFAALLGLWVSRWMTRPVEALTSGARRVAEGALDVQVAARASGEVGELVRTFNHMTSELKATTERLMATERIAAWQEVARRLAHEIKNPLTPIRMSLETLLAAHEARHPSFPNLFKESAGVILEEVERLRRIVDEFSRFARLPKPQLAPVDLGELAQGVLSLYAAPPEGIQLQPALQTGVVARADRDQLTQVLVNLVKNAEEAMTGKGGALRVRVKGTDADAVIEVEDDGPGIPAEHRARIFEPYFTTKDGGTGLGLAIAARILQEHGGRLEVGGEPGQGARFSVVLPRAS
ncbi:HAMP domain-containing protein [Corallococcus praedator]|uniref:Signal transduction histidine-protein kinase/phosphatase MprB n=1 Tax=Corallococcus praedator TaxID=2316724 RepID=A0ABX9QA51_9BACT|nr:MULTISPECIES: ATP-binding protein [Corallococcus]RKH21715.1 HAMP domain-containing protein [Corallococcus sp. CA031C]RKH94231.1 HAMP domain-containing protein [Corallococcus praedator]